MTPPAHFYRGALLPPLARGATSVRGGLVSLNHFQLGVILPVGLCLCCWSLGVAGRVGAGNRQHTLRLVCFPELSSHRFPLKLPPKRSLQTLFLLLFLFLLLRLVRFCVFLSVISRFKASQPGLRSPCRTEFFLENRFSVRFKKK